MKPRTRIKAHVKSFRELVLYYARGLYSEFRDKSVFLWAQAIAFKVLVALVPIIILATGLSGQLLRRERPFRYVETMIRDFWPAYQSDELITFLGQIQTAAGTLTLIGALGLAITAITLFTTLRNVLSSIFQEHWHATRSILHGYAFDLRMALQVGLLFSGSILLTILAQTLRSSAEGQFEQIGLRFAWLQEGWQVGIGWFAVIFPFLLSVGMFYQLIYLVPKPHPPQRSALAGAFLSTLLWESTKVGFTIYASRIAGFEHSWNATLGDTFVLIIVIVFWAYLSGVVLIIGALFTLLYERRHRLSELRISEPGGTGGVESISYSVTASQLDGE